MIKYEKIPLETLRVVYQHAEPSDLLIVSAILNTLWCQREKLLFYVQNAKWDFFL